MTEANLPAIRAMDLLKPSNAHSTMLMMQAMPQVLTDEQFGQVRDVAQSFLPAMPGITDKAFAEAMLMLNTLPRRKDEAITGEVRLRLYKRFTEHMPAKQIWWTIEESIKRCKFAPSVSELLIIASEWRRSDDAVDAQRLARIMVNREANRRHIESTRKPPPPPLTQDAVDGFPPDTIALGLKCGALIQVDGTVLINPDQNERNDA